MSILVIKKFDVIMREMDEMMGDVNSLKPSQISFNVSGVFMEFEDVTIELHNGFLKVIGDDGVDVLRYRDVCGYSLKSLNPPKVFAPNGEVYGVCDVTDRFMDDVWSELCDTPSTLPKDILNKEIPFNIFKKAVCGFFVEFEGLSDEEEIYEDEWMSERYNEWINWYKNNNPSYGDLNDKMSGFLWDLHYPHHFLRDDCLSDLRGGVNWDYRDYLWVNDVISHYVDLFKGDDEDE